MSPTKKDAPEVIQILSGLLASGHYTIPGDGTDPDVPCVWHRDLGKNWEQDGWPSRYYSAAIEDAIMLWRELNEELTPPPIIKPETAPPTHPVDAEAGRKMFSEMRKVLET